eukprot:354900-Chlamydomonas_euryale.AAC.5
MALKASGPYHCHASAGQRTTGNPDVTLRTCLWIAMAKRIRRTKHTSGPGASPGPSARPDGAGGGPGNTGGGGSSAIKFFGTPPQAPTRTTPPARVHDSKTSVPELSRAPIRGQAFE